MSGRRFRVSRRHAFSFDLPFRGAARLAGGLLSFVIPSGVFYRPIFTIEITRASCRKPDSSSWGLHFIRANERNHRRILTARHCAGGSADAEVWSEYSAYSAGKGFLLSAEQLDQGVCVARKNLSGELPLLLVRSSPCLKKRTGGDGQSDRVDPFVLAP